MVSTSEKKDTLLLTAHLRLALALEDGEGCGRVRWWGGDGTGIGDD